MTSLASTMPVKKLRSMLFCGGLEDVDGFGEGPRQVKSIEKQWFLRRTSGKKCSEGAKRSVRGATCSELSLNSPKVREVI